MQPWASDESTAEVNKVSLWKFVTVMKKEEDKPKPIFVTLIKYQYINDLHYQIFLSYLGLFDFSCSK